MRVLLFGTFDHLHPGHQFVFAEAQKRAAEAQHSEIFVVIARDANVERIKGRLPDEREDVRKQNVEKALADTAVSGVASRATVVLGDPEDFLQPVREIQPDLILLGYDQRLPPGISDADLPCPIERLPPHQPERFKSSLRRS